MIQATVDAWLCASRLIWRTGDTFVVRVKSVDADAAITRFAEAVQNGGTGQAPSAQPPKRPGIWRVLL